MALRRLERWANAPPAELAREFKRVLGQAYVEAGRPREALALLVDVAGDPPLQLWRSRALFLSGDMEGAAAELAPLADEIARWGVEQAPDGQRALMGDILVDYARTLTALGRAPEAVAVLEPAVTALDSRRGWQVLAQALVAAGRGEDARAALNRGASLLAADH